MTPSFIVIGEVAGESADGSVALAMVLGAAPPPGSPLVGVVVYGFDLDTNGDGDWDYRAALELVPGGGYVPVLIDRATGQRQEAGSFPGRANVTGARVSLVVSLAAIGCPAFVGVRATAEQTRSGITTRHEAPDAPDVWRVETGC